MGPHPLFRLGFLCRFLRGGRELKELSDLERAGVQSDISDCSELDVSEFESCADTGCPRNLVRFLFRISLFVRFLLAALAFALGLPQGGKEPLSQGDLRLPQGGLRLRETNGSLTTLVLSQGDVKLAACRSLGERAPTQGVKKPLPQGGLLLIGLNPLNGLKVGVIGPPLDDRLLELGTAFPVCSFNVEG